MMLINAVFLLSVLCGCVAALRGNRTAAALLIATAIGSAMTVTNVDFNPFIWILIDIGVITVALGPYMKFSDMAVAVLFIPIWSLYTVHGWAAFYAVSLLTSLQFFLTFPLTEVFGWVSKKTHKIFQTDDRLKLTT